MNAVDFRSFDSASGLVVVLDRDGRIVHWTPACSELTGHSLEEVRGRCAWDFLLRRADREAARAAFAEVRDRGLPARFENWITRDGQRQRLLWSSSVRTGSDGGVEHVVASAVAVATPEPLQAELRRLREDLREKEAHLRAVFEHAFQSIGLLAPDGTVLEANRSALEFAGVRREDVVGRPIWDTAWWRGRPDLQERVRNAVREAAQGRFDRFEATHSSADGRIATIDFSLTPVRDEGGRVVLLVPEGRDITERKQREARQEFLAEAGGILAAALEYRDPLLEIARLAVHHLADCCIVDLVDPEGGVRRVAVAHATEPRPWFADVLERVLVDRARTHLVSAVLDAQQPILVTDVRPGDLEVLAHDEDHLRALRALDPRSIIGVPLLARGRSIGALVFVSSRPERRYGLEDVRVALDVAARAALAVENARLYRTACEAIEARDRILAIVAHDLRSPLQAALLAARTVQTSCSGDGAREAGARRAAETMLRSVERADRLIQDLLEVTQIESGGLSLERASVPPRELVADAVETFGPASAEASLRLEVETAEGLPNVLADRGRMLQVFSNLIGNAVKFTPPGGRIRIAAEPRQAYVCFSIADTGPGIAAEQVPHLFDRFWQGRRTDRRGTGQGLPIAKGIVEAHGGSIWTESTPGRGTTFSFTVPVDSAARARQEETGPAGP